MPDYLASSKCFAYRNCYLQAQEYPNGWLGEIYETGEIIQGETITELVENFHDAVETLIFNATRSKHDNRETWKN